MKILLKSKKTNNPASIRGKKEKRWIDCLKVNHLFLLFIFLIKIKEITNPIINAKLFIKKSFLTS